MKLTFQTTDGVIALDREDIYCEKELHVFGENVTEIPNDIADQFPNATSVCFEFNKITMIPVSLSHLKHLTVLNLGLNKLKSFPDIKFEHLEQLHLDRNKGIVFKPKAELLPRLRVLALNKCAIGKITPDMFMLPTLQQLDLSDNDFTYIPSGIFRGCNMLCRFIANVCKIEQIAHDAFGATKLQQIDLRSNKIVVLPDDLFNDSLRTLYLDTNKIEEFPECIKRLKLLKTLYISDNPIVSFDDAFDNLGDLRTLNAYGNKAFIKCWMIVHMTKLENLRVSSDESIDKMLVRMTLMRRKL